MDGPCRRRSSARARAWLSSAGRSRVHSGFSGGGQFAHRFAYPLWITLLKLPRAILDAGILTFAILGSYAITQNTVDVLVAIAFGTVGFLMRRTGYPVAPLILGAVLGPMLETRFRRALAFSEGDPSVFITRPLSAIILALAAMALIGPTLVRRRTTATASPEELRR